MRNDEFADWISCAQPPDDGSRNQSDAIRIPDAARTLILFNSTSCFLLTMLAIIMNSIFLISVKRDRTLRTASLKLLTVLGVTDLFQGGISFPMYGAYLFNVAQNNNACVIKYTISVIGQAFALHSILNIFSIVFFQYLCILKPLHYRPDTPVLRMIILVHILGFANLIIAIFQYKFRTFDFHRFFISVIVVMLLIAMIFFFTHMPIIIKKSSVGARNNDVSETFEQQRQAVRVRRSNIKLSKMSFVILIAFVTSYMPAIVFTIFLQKQMTYLMFHVRCSLMILGQSNCILDCLVYQLMHVRVRKAILRFLWSAVKSGSDKERSGAIMHDRSFSDRFYRIRSDVGVEKLNYRHTIGRCFVVKYIPNPRSLSF